MSKLNAKLQTAGEETYASDIPEPANCLHGAYVPVPKAGAEITAIDTKKALELPGVAKVITAEDVQGENLAEGMGPLAAPKAIMVFVPVGGTSQYAGQPCALVL